jgi:hypothetical protein
MFLANYGARFVYRSRGIESRGKGELINPLPHYTLAVLCNPVKAIFLSRFCEGACFVRNWAPFFARFMFVCVSAPGCSLNSMSMGMRVKSSRAVCLQSQATNIIRRWQRQHRCRPFSVLSARVGIASATARACCISIQCLLNEPRVIFALFLSLSELGGVHDDLHRMRLGPCKEQDKSAPVRQSRLDTGSEGPQRELVFVSY